MRALLTILTLCVAALGQTTVLPKTTILSKTALIGSGAGGGGGANTWSFRSFANTTASGTNPQSVTVASTVAHDLLVAGLEVESGGGTVTISAVSGGCNVTWLHVPSSNLSTGSSRSVDLYYCTDALAGTTSISITATGTINTGLRTMVWQATPSTGSSVIDTGATPVATQNDTTNFCSATCPSGVALTLSGSNNFVVGVAAASGTVSNIGAGNGCVKDFGDGAGGLGAMHCLNNASATYPVTWTNAVGAGIVMNGAAFK
jgi:hypothetical protein